MSIPLLAAHFRYTTSPNGYCLCSQSIWQLQPPHITSPVLFNKHGLRIRQSNAYSVAS
jgi:hypothetical protein